MRNIAFTRRSSAFSRSSARIRAASADAVPGRKPRSTCACLAQPRSVSALIPSSAPTFRQPAVTLASWSLTTSSTSRIARSRSSSGYFRAAPIVPLPRGLGASTKPRAIQCDIAVLRTAVDSKRFASAIVGQERRYCALAADDPWARRRSIRLDEVSQHIVLIDRRTGTTTPDLWPAAAQPPIQETHDIDDWLAIIAAGGGIGITPEGTTAQYRRDGVVFRQLHDAPPVTVQMIWRQHDPHLSTHAAIAMLTELYRRPS